MLPILDMLNHAHEGTRECNCEVSFTGSGDAEMRTVRDVKAGEELCFGYHQDGSSDAKRFANYGIRPYDAA